jgi:hypothetical protein
MAAKFLNRTQNMLLARRCVLSQMAALGVVTLTALVTTVQAGPSKQRVDWEKLSPEQQSAVKSSGLQAKETTTASQKYYVYQEGRRTSIKVSGEGAQATFRVEGSGTDLRYDGRGEIKLITSKTPADLKSALELHGIQLGTSMDASGLIWTVLTAPGLAGLKALNQLKESGVVASATPDWRRDLRKK